MEDETLPIDEERTAHHEAGHALIGIRRGIRLLRLELGGTEGMLGRAEWDPSFVPPDEYAIPPDPHVKASRLRWIDMTLAGDLSARLLRGPAGAFDVSGDVLLARNHAMYLVAGDLSTLDSLLAERRATIETELSAYWPTVRAIASALLMERTLLGEHVRAVVAGG